MKQQSWDESRIKFNKLIYKTTKILLLIISYFCNTYKISCFGNINFIYLLFYISARCIKIYILIDLGQGSATYGQQAGSRLPRKIIQYAVYLQIIVLDGLHNGF